MTDEGLNGRIKNRFAKAEKRPITIAKESGHWMLIDGGDNPGYLVAHYAMNTAIENYFNSSYKNVVSFFAKEEKISVDELKEIIALIENKK